MAGIVVVLPIVAGPILLILYLEHGTGFAADAARAATLAIVPLALFTLIFGYLSKRHRWQLTLVISWAVVLAADFALAQIPVPAGLALLLALLALHTVGALLRRLDQQPSAPLPTPWWDLPARAMATALLVVLVTGFAAALGSRAGWCANALSNCAQCGVRLYNSSGRSRGCSGTAPRHRARIRRLCDLLFSSRGLDQPSGRPGGFRDSHCGGGDLCGAACCSDSSCSASTLLG
jgi:hypothetical protein